MKELQKLTTELMTIVKEANEIYHEKRKTNEKGDFYQEVKPFADRANKVSIHWKKEIETQLQQGGFKYIHQPQVKAVVENIELVSVQAFFPETSYTRFKNYIESTNFLLNSLLKELK
ncbi:DUF1798 family protein [Bacillus sp. FJAT-52991]|uniref:DUF1798 family protein n=1 Tax=Bacillus kandeliae TaxID=3129297 RepID=A0ABZ2N2H8_9BACI